MTSLQVERSQIKVLMTRFSRVDIATLELMCPQSTVRRFIHRSHPYERRQQRQNCGSRNIHKKTATDDTER